MAADSGRNTSKHIVSGGGFEIERNQYFIPLHSFYFSTSHPRKVAFAHLFNRIYRCSEFHFLKTLPLGCPKTTSAQTSQLQPRVCRNSLNPTNANFLQRQLIIFYKKRKGVLFFSLSKRKKIYLEKNQQKYIHYQNKIKHS